MKKIIFFLCLNFMFVSSVNASIIVMDLDTNRPLYEKNSHDERLIASTTKIMTAIVVLENANLDDIVKVPYDVLKTTGSNIYIEIGEELTVLDLLYGLMLRSGNDAAIALANHVAKNEENFTDMMNNYAKKLNLKNTHFVNASGLENSDGKGNTSTPYDMAILTSYAFKNKQFMNIIETKKKIVKSSYKTYEWTNKNKLLFDYKYCLGGKTGYTKKAKRTLVTIASKDNKHLAIVTLNEKDDFKLHKNLYEKYFKKYNLVTLVDKNLFVLDDNTYIKNNVKILLNEKEKNLVDLKIVKLNDITKRYGYIDVSLDGKTYIKEDIYLCEKKSFLEKLKNFFMKWF